MPLRLDLADLQAVIHRLAEVFEEHRSQLNELDARIGDGDHGLSMSRGFNAVQDHFEDNPPAGISAALTQGGMQFNEKAGSTIGVLIFSAMRQAGRAVEGKADLGLPDLAAMLEAAVEAIRKRGKAEPKQKTILDSLHPSLLALRAGLAASEPEEKTVRRAMEAAARGAESTREMRAGIGRARWFAERSVGELDPGAVSGRLIVETVGAYLLERAEKGTGTR
jgi:dihydroxyacetone kinase-like protein